MWDLLQSLTPNFVYRVFYETLDIELDGAFLLLCWLSIGLTGAATVTAMVRRRTTRRKLARTASAIWIIAFAWAYLDQSFAAGFNPGPESWRHYKHVFSTILPAWFFLGLAILWCGYWLRGWVDGPEKRTRKLT